MTATATKPTVSITNGLKYISAEYRGTSYCLSRNGDGWFVSSRRLALGRWNMGGGKCYATLADVAAGCKAFGSAAVLAEMAFGF